jgi:hypothetical protein
MQVRNLYRSVAATFFLSALMAVSANGQLIHQEGFNDDGDGTRYTVFGRGSAVTAEGPGMWEHNFLVDQIGLVGSAPAKRAAILFNHAVMFADDFTPEAYQLWTNLANWAMDDKQNATIGFFPGYGSANAAFGSVFELSEMFTEQGHNVIEIPDVASLPPAAELDLLIHTSEASPVPPPAFSNYDVPGIFFRSENHDDTLLSQIGAVYMFPDPDLSLDVVAANADHPVLEGLPNPVPWTGPFATNISLEGMGKPPSGGKVLLTFEDPANPGVMRNGLIVVEEGGGLLGSLTARPEGTGFFVGASLNKFGDMLTRALEINPIDISGQSDVMLTVSLTATDADFEVDDILRVLVGQAGTPVEEFTVLSTYVGIADATSPCIRALSSDGGTSCLTPTEFTDVTWNISELAPDISNLVVRFEALSTFPNEIVGIDNVRIFAGEIMPPEGIPGDYNNNGTVEQADLDLVLLNWGQPGVPNGWTNDLPEGNIDQAELDGVLLNWGNVAALGSAAGVPEPGSLALVFFVLSAAAFRIRARLRAR